MLNTLKILIGLEHLTFQMLKFKIYEYAKTKNMQAS